MLRQTVPQGNRAKWNKQSDRVKPASQAKEIGYEYEITLHSSSKKSYSVMDNTHDALPQDRSPKRNDSSQQSSENHNRRIYIPKLQPDFEVMQRHLELAAPGDERHCIQLFDDVVFADGTRREDKRLAQTLVGTIDKLADEIISYQRSGAGVFYAINRIVPPRDERGVERLRGSGIRVKNNVSHIRAVHSDNDKGYRGGYPLAPTITVQTSISADGLAKLQETWVAKEPWLADAAAQAEHRDIQERLTRDYGNDPKATDITRVFRLAGSFHLKNPAKPQVVELIGQGACYPRLDVVRVFSPIIGTSGRKYVNGHSFDTESSLERFKRVRAIVERITLWDNQHWYIMRRILQRLLGEAGWLLFLEACARSPKYPGEKVCRKEWERGPEPQDDEDEGFCWDTLKRWAAEDLRKAEADSAEALKFDGIELSETEAQLCSVLPYLLAQASNEADSSDVLRILAHSKLEHKRNITEAVFWSIRRSEPGEGFEMIWTKLCNTAAPDGKTIGDLIALGEYHKEIDRLARLKEADYAYQKKAAKERFGYPLATIDKIVKERREQLKKEEECVSSDSEGKSQTDVIVKLALQNATLFHSPDGAPYADVKHDGFDETVLVVAGEFSEYLDFKYFTATGGSCNETSLKGAVRQLSALAKYKGEQREVYKRVAALENGIYIDIGDAEGTIIEVAKAGIALSKDFPLKFSRSRHTRPLPKPDLDGTIKDLDRYLGLHGHNRILTIAWATFTLLGKPPYPILQLTAPAGGMKSTTAAKISRIIDPRKPVLRARPKEAKDIFIAGLHSHLVAYDNLSGLSADLSDILCMLATGGGFAARSLYTNEEEHVIEVANPVLLTGVSSVISRQDLMDRTVNIELPMIDERQRRTSEDVAREAQELAPKAFGALLKIVAHGLKHIENIQPLRLPRMAGFAKWGMAIEGALGVPEGTFEEAYERNRTDALKDLADGNHVAIALGQFMGDKQSWTGTATELLRLLTVRHKMANDEHVDKNFPRTPNILSRRLFGDLAPILKNMGIVIDRKGGDDRSITLERAAG